MRTSDVLERQKSNLGICAVLLPVNEVRCIVGCLEVGGGVNEV